jgi:hypothetical protein
LLSDNVNQTPKMTSLQFTMNDLFSQRSKKNWNWNSGTASWGLFCSSSVSLHIFHWSHWVIARVGQGLDPEARAASGSPGSGVCSDVPTSLRRSSLGPEQIYYPVC